MKELFWNGEMFWSLLGNFYSPLFYAAILFIYWQYRQQNLLERKLFGVRVTSALSQTGWSLLLGICGGALATLLLSLLGVILHPKDFLYMWVVALCLAFINVRYLCFAYAGGVISLVSLVFQHLTPITPAHPFFAMVYRDLLEVQVVHVLALVGVLHLVEAVLVLLQGGEGAAPVFVVSKRGRLVGGFVLQKYWIMPLAAMVASGASSALPVPGGGGVIPLGSTGGGQFMPVPVLSGYSGVVLAHHPREKARRTSRFLALYALILLLCVIAGTRIPALLWLAAFLSPFLHEGLVYWERMDEWERTPRFVQPHKGLRILDVLPHSPACTMGLHRGEVILKANGVMVNTPFDLHFAIDQNPAFIRLEVVDERGEPRLVHKPLYEGEHHALGLILVPDEGCGHYVQLETFSPWRSFWRRMRKRGPYSTYANTCSDQSEKSM